jgi:hypothetical protein
MFEQISRFDAADKNTRNQQPSEGGAILALMEGVLWGLVLLLSVLWNVVER